MKAVSERRWAVREHDGDTAKIIAGELSIDPFLAALLVNRGVASAWS